MTKLLFTVILWCIVCEGIGGGGPRPIRCPCWSPGSRPAGDTRSVELSDMLDLKYPKHKVYCLFSLNLFLMIAFWNRAMNSKQKQTAGLATKETKYNWIKWVYLDDLTEVLVLPSWLSSSVVVSPSSESVAPPPPPTDEPRKVVDALLELLNSGPAIKTMGLPVSYARAKANLFQKMNCVAMIREM